MVGSVLVFGSTLHKTDEWVSQVAGALSTSDRQLAYRVLRGVLHALRDRLATREAARFGNQLPMLLRGSYYESWTPAEPPHDDRASFLRRVRESLAGLPAAPDPETCVRAVFLVLARRMDTGEVEDMRNFLPDAVRDLGPESWND